MHESDSVIRGVLDAGARGYVLKTDAGRDLVSAVDSLRRNKTFFTSRVSQMILDGFLKGDSRPQDTPGGTRLTPRQREIVQLLAEGKSSKEVAVALDLSVKTAETHRAISCGSSTAIRSVKWSATRFATKSSKHKRL